MNTTHRNKINACKEKKVEYHLTCGRVTCFMDIATFELFRAACLLFYTSFPEDERPCEITDSDSDNAPSVQHSFIK